MTQPSTRRRPQGPTGSTRRTAGFTLIELMIAVAVIGILASIAYPSYQRYITESRRTDAKALLMEAAGELERCFTIRNNYEECFEDRGLGGRDSENKYYSLSPSGNISITPHSYIIEADVGPNAAQRKDTNCLPMTLSHRGERQPDACW